MSKGAWLLGGCAVLGLSWSVGMLSFADAPSQAVPETGVANAVSVDLIAQAREAPEIGQWDRTSEDFDSRKKRWDDTLTFEVDAGDISVFDVVTPHGDVVIVGDDGDVIRVSARRVVRSSKEDKGATYREGFRPVARMDGNVLAVGVLRPEGKNKRRPKHVKEAFVDFTIAVPPRLAERMGGMAGPAIHVQSGHGDVVAKGVRPDMLSLRSGHGDVAIAEITGDAELHSGHGDISVTKSQLGRFEAHTGHGDIVSSDVQGTAAIHTGHGDVRLERVEGGVGARTGHGDVEVAWCAGSVDLHTGHGDLSVVGGPLDSLTAKSGSGDVRAELSGEAGAISLTTGSGDISLRAEGAETLNAHTGRGDISGEVTGAVSGETDLHTGHGSVTLRGASLGSLSVRTGAGDLDVTVSEVLMGARVTTGAGDVSVKVKTADSVEAHTGRGSVRVAAVDVAGVLNLRSNHGDVGVLAESVGELVAHSGTGAVEAVLGASENGADLNTGNGDVTLAVGRDTSFALEASTAAGQVTSSLDLEDADRRKDGRALSGARLGGGPAIRLRSGRGDIDVSSR